jgi:hypothetical protein
MLVGTFESVSPGTARYVAIDFTADLDQGDAVASAVVAVTVSAISTVIDPNAGALARGAPVINGNQVVERVGGPYVAGQSGFQPGVTYVVTMSATTLGGKTLVHCGRLPCGALP